MVFSSDDSLVSTPSKSVLELTVAAPSSPSTTRPISTLASSHATTTPHTEHVPRMPLIPTWKEAEAVVFDSSSDHSDSTEDLHAPSPAPQLRSAQPTPPTRSSRRRTRSMTAKERFEMNAASAQAQPTPASQVPMPSANKHNDRYRPKPS